MQTKKTKKQNENIFFISEIIRSENVAIKLPLVRREYLSMAAKGLKK